MLVFGSLYANFHSYKLDDTVQGLNFINRFIYRIFSLKSVTRKLLENIIKKINF